MSTVKMPYLPRGAQTPFEKELVRVLQEHLTNHARAINQNARGRFSAWKASSDVEPELPGSPGDTVRNTNPAVLGAVGSQYVIDGWRYGDDDLWHEISHLTDG
jgi:hypothetical protein